MKEYLSRPVSDRSLLVQALAGLARSITTPTPMTRPAGATPGGTSSTFSWLCMCDDTVTGVDLAAAACVLDRQADADRFVARARVTREQR